MLDTAHLIVHAATQLFAHHGYAGTALRDIASHLHITIGTLYYHFRTKDALLAAVIAPYLANAHASIHTHRHDPTALAADLARLRFAHADIAALTIDPTIRAADTPTAALRELDDHILAVLTGNRPTAERRRRALLALSTINAAGTTLPAPTNARATAQSTREIADTVALILAQ